MIRVKQLIEILEKENQDAFVLVDGYEYHMEYLRIENIDTGKFTAPEGSDIDFYGGCIVENNQGVSDFVKFGRST